VLDPLDGVLFALRTLRRFVRESIDAPGRFCEKQVLLQNFTRDLILDVTKSGFWLNRRPIGCMPQGARLFPSSLCLY
jgi:hypothetical protein